jgi:hypothetical protein
MVYRNLLDPNDARRGDAKLALVLFEGPTVANVGFVVQRHDGGTSGSISMSSDVPDDVLSHTLRPEFMRIRRKARNDPNATQSQPWQSSLWNDATSLSTRCLMSSVMS